MSSKSLSSWQIHRYWWESSRSSAIQCFLIMLNEGHVVNAYIPWLYWKDESAMRNTYSHDFLFVPGQKSARFPLEEKYFRWSVCVLWQNSSSVNARLSLFCRHGCRVFEDSPQCVHSLNVATSNIRLLSLCWFSGGSRLGEQWFISFQVESRKYISIASSNLVSISSSSLRMIASKSHQVDRGLLHEV